MLLSRKLYRVCGVCMRCACLVFVNGFRVIALVVVGVIECFKSFTLVSCTLFSFYFGVVIVCCSSTLFNNVARCSSAMLVVLPAWSDGIILEGGFFNKYVISAAALRK